MEDFRKQYINVTNYTNTNTMLHIERVTAVIQKNNCVLLVKSNKYSTYWLPGGTKEQGETKEQALIRELQEEIQVTPKTYNHLQTHHFDHPQKEGITVTEHVYLVEIDTQPQPDHEIDAIYWMNQEEFENNKYSLYPITRKQVFEKHKSILF